MPTRRAFLVTLPTAVLGLLLAGPRRLLAVRATGTDHPEPRPGVDASRVVPPGRLPRHVVRVFDRVRAIPQVVDGLRCHCGCSDIPGFYSLLSCFEGEGMAQHCEVCRAEADLAYTLHRRGRSLADIRSAVDERYG